jgi:hypothetical protein
MHQRLVIAVFVTLAELQVPVEIKPKIVARAGEDDALVGR